LCDLFATDKVISHEREIMKRKLYRIKDKYFYLLDCLLA